MEHCKLQIGCLVVLLYIAFIYIKNTGRCTGENGGGMFRGLLLLGTLSVVLDGVTAYMVNNISSVNPILNITMHALFLISLDTVIFVLFLYMMLITGAYPESKFNRMRIFAPFAVNIIVVVLNIGSLEYVQGTVTNYSMGMSAYTCFVMAAVYIGFSITVFFSRWNYIESHKRVSIFTYLLVLATITLVQMVFPETLISSIGVTVSVLGIYMNLENPALKELAHNHSEFVMSLANMIENHDSNTGGHIKRTSMYVQLMAEELRSRGYYKDILTKDYITNLIKAAPMHDIGKISVPDSILRKPGKLTDEEFAVMKQHSENGGKIIQEAFGNLGNKEYLDMAYEVARFHHEKWNGRGYPEGRKRKEIPLCARIMAVADVFDAVSEKRCYREAMPLDKCFEIIEQGSGQDFDPMLAEVFIDIRDKVEAVHSAFAGAE